MANCYQMLFNFENSIKFYEKILSNSKKIYGFYSNNMSLIYFKYKFKYY